MCWLDQCNSQRCAGCQQPRIRKQFVDMDSFAAASLGKKYMPEL
jgi:hypothetical protein